MLPGGRVLRLGPASSFSIYPTLNVNCQPLPSECPTHAVHHYSNQMLNIASPLCCPVSLISKLTFMGPPWHREIVSTERMREIYIYERKKRKEKKRKEKKRKQRQVKKKAFGEYGRIVHVSSLHIRN